MFQRIIAFSLDLLIRGLWFTISTTIMIMLIGNVSAAFESENFSYMALGFLLINLFATTWLYPVLFEVFNHGRTPGKMAAKIRVLHDNGSPIGWSASMLRNLLRVFDGLPFAYAIGMVSMLLSPKGQRIGDVFAGTIVVDEHTERQIGRLAYLEHIPSVTPPVMLTREEQYSIVSFTERHPRLPRVRLPRVGTRRATTSSSNSSGAGSRPRSRSVWSIASSPRTATASCASSTTATS